MNNITFNCKCPLAPSGFPQKEKKYLEQISHSHHMCRLHLKQSKQHMMYPEHTNLTTKCGRFMHCNISGSINGFFLMNVFLFDFHEYLMYTYSWVFNLSTA